MPIDIEAECQDDYMKIRIGFNGSFGGLLYSSGYSYDPDCVYINGTGRDYYEFYIQLNRCGTLGKNSRQEDARKNPAVSLGWLFVLIAIIVYSIINTPVPDLWPVVG